MTTTYDRFPSIPIRGRDHEAWSSYRAIAGELADRLPKGGRAVLTIECYPGVRQEEVLDGLSALGAAAVIRAEEAALDREALEGLLARYLTDDRVFGLMAPLRIRDFYCPNKLQRLQARASGAAGLVVVIGTGASLVAEGDVRVYADLTRWEIQLRYRTKELGNWLADNRDEDTLRKYKRGFFVEWRAADRLKREFAPRADYYLDTVVAGEPKLVAREALFDGLRQTARRPFRLVPYFDPGVWGGRWLQERIGLEPMEHPYAWGFDGVPEENSLHLDFGGVRLDVPAINLVLFEPKALLGERVYARFGAEFPIRFDFLDTIGGQPLSLQVHPVVDYIRETFGMSYTQDESYYILDAEPGASVYLGLREGIDRREMIEELRLAQEGGRSFPADRYVNVYPARKHDHFLIPAGTIHCSGTNAMVLEISATPYIFTFKLWDWDRLGLDGKPRPVHLEHGIRNIEWDRTTGWVDGNLVNRIVLLAEDDGWTEERTGLHELEFIETRRHWFDAPVPHDTGGGVHMLNLVEGEEAVVESPTGAFEPLTIRYAETFIVPAAVGAYTIRPLRAAGDGRLATIRASVRT